MKNITLTRDFFLGGKAIFTVQNNDTGEHRTYRIKASKPNDRYPNPAYFVGLLSGPDNTSSYQYLGMVDPQNGNVRLTAKSRMTEESAAVKGIRYVLGRVFSSGQIHDQMEVRHAGHCGRCGKTLTEPKSLDCGLGPCCRKALGYAD